MFEFRVDVQNSIAVVSKMSRSLRRRGYRAISGNMNLSLCSGLLPTIKTY